MQLDSDLDVQKDPDVDADGEDDDEDELDDTPQISHAPASSSTYLAKHVVSASPHPFANAMVR
jgi:chromodomain-helicase-DNA-binding protein 1